MNWSEDELADYLARNGVEGKAPRTDVSKPPFKLPGNQAGRFALGRLKTGAMNKTEAAYFEYLAEIKHAGQILWFCFEAVKLRLADNTFYTPDFAVMVKDGTIELHEVKGFWQDDARVKIKVAADKYPFRFIAVTAEAKKRGGGWKVEEF